MRNMSFALTTEKIRDKSKDVTRRMGWWNLKDGEQFQPVIKCMGLKKGEKIVKIGTPVVQRTSTKESLRRMINEPLYGQSECIREGFPELEPAEFVQMFCASHKGCTPDTVLNRIEFIYQKLELIHG